MSNTFLTISMITNEALAVLENSLTFTKQVNRQYDSKFAIEGAKIGTALNIRNPVRYVGRDSANMSTEDIKESQKTLTLNHQWGVDISFSSADLLLNISEFSDRLIKPAVARIANMIDYEGMNLYKSVANTVGVPGTTPDELFTYLLAGVAMDNESAPQDEARALVINPYMQAKIVNELKGLFQSQPQIKAQYEKGKMGVAAGFNWFMDQNVRVHTVGPQGGTPQSSGTQTNGTILLVTKGWTASAASRLVAGDTFTIDTVYATNPQNGQSTGELRRFVVTTAFSSDGSGNGSVGIDPPINDGSGTTVAASGKTVTILPVDGSAINVLGAGGALSPQGLAFHRDAFTFASADLPLPRGTDMAARVSSSKLGVSIRLIRDYTIATDLFPCRLDVLGGWLAVRPELACRVSG